VSLLGIFRDAIDFLSLARREPEATSHIAGGTERHGMASIFRCSVHGFILFLWCGDMLRPELHKFSYRVCIGPACEVEAASEVLPRPHSLRTKRHQLQFKLQTPCMDRSEHCR